MRVAKCKHTHQTVLQSSLPCYKVPYMLPQRLSPTTTLSDATSCTKAFLMHNIETLLNQELLDVPDPDRLHTHEQEASPLESLRYKLCEARDYTSDTMLEGPLFLWSMHCSCHVSNSVVVCCTSEVPRIDAGLTFRSKGRIQDLKAGFKVQTQVQWDEFYTIVPGIQAGAVPFPEHPRALVQKQSIVSR